jgi:putative peptidoglycan lipid II flippase
MSRPIVGLLFQRGQFTAIDTEQTAVALAYYCIGLAAYSAIKVLTPAYYALHDVRIPMMTSVGSIVVNYAMNWTFIRVLGWGHAGLAFSTSLVATCNFLVLFWLMRDKAGGVEGQRLARSVVKITVASTLMGAACWASSFVVRMELGESVFARLVDVVVSLPMSIYILYHACHWLHVQELIAARQAIAGRFRGSRGNRREDEPYDRIERNGF